jgi:rhomboid family GlyGly-CTERM serine protease
VADEPRKLRPAATAGGRGPPWATALYGAAAVLAWAWPAAGAAAIYDRGAILAGQVWRGWTGHAVHLDTSHLLWNLAVFVFVGVWLERVAPRMARRFLTLAPPAISGVLLAFEPDLARYAGLSGLATGLVVLLALDRLWAGGREPRWVWLTALALVAAKMLAETATDGALFAGLGAGVRVVPLAHVAGVAAALAAFFSGHRKIWLR